MSVRDLTAAVTTRIRDTLGPGERVLAGIAVDLEGTTAAALDMGTSAAVGSAVGGHSVRVGSHAPELPGAKEAAGTDATPRMVLALTSTRLLLLKRRPFGIVGPVVLDVPLAEVTGLTMSKRSQKVVLATARGTVPLELPRAWKFLPPVYASVPALFEQARRGDLQ